MAPILHHCCPFSNPSALIHVLLPRSCGHVFHMDCLIDQVFARTRCPICHAMIVRAEYWDGSGGFERMPLADVFEEGVMRAMRKRRRVMGDNRKTEEGAEVKVEIRGEEEEDPRAVAANSRLATVKD